MEVLIKVDINKQMEQKYLLYFCGCRADYLCHEVFATECLNETLPASKDISALFIEKLIAKSDPLYQIHIDDLRVS